jgi:hypothetical protein
LQETATPLNSASTHTIDGNGIINANAALGYNYLLVSDTNILFSSEANQTRKFIVYSYVDWTIDSIPSLLNIQPTSGSAGETEVTIKTNSSNESPALYTIQLKIKSDEMNPNIFKFIRLIMKSLPTFFLNISYYKGQKTVPIQSLLIPMLVGK